MGMLFRLIIISITVLVLACGPERTEKSQVRNVPQDSLSQPVRESFDLQVKKYEDPKRQNWQDPKFVIQALGDLNNKAIADIGSGTGYFTFQMAVPARKVIAIDIEQRFLNYIEDRKTEMYDRNLAGKIETRLTKPDDPMLQEGEVDIVLMVNTIGFINNRDNYLSRIYKGLTANGTMVIVDYRRGDMPVGPSEDLKVDKETIADELKRVGFVIENLDTSSLQYQYLIKSRKKE